MIETVADIPRYLTAIAEASACLVYVLLARRRHRLGPTLGLVGLGGSLLVTTQWIAGLLPLALWVPGMLGAAAVMAGLLWATTQTGVREAGYLTARAFVLSELVAAAGWQLGQYYALALPHIRIPVFLAVTGVGLVVAYVVERRHFPSAASLEVGTSDVVGAFAIAGATFALSNLSFVSANTPLSGRVGPELLYIRTLVDFCGFVALYLQHRARSEANARRESEAMSQLVRSQHDQYEISRRSLEEFNRKYHDMKHHLEAIRAESDSSLRARILDELDDSLRRYGARVRTGNSILDAVLSVKRGYADEKGIDVSYVADGALLDFLLPLDLTAIVGNAMDNAIEAAGRLAQQDERIVRLALFQQDGFALLRVENTFDGVIRRRDGRMATRKLSDGHGYGLRNIELAAERYDGVVAIGTTDNWFALRVLIPLPDSSVTQPSFESAR